MLNKLLLFIIFFFSYTLLMIYSGRSGFYDTYSMRDFFVANNSLGLFLSTSTFIATWFSAASFLGLGSFLYMYGIAGILHSIMPWFIGALMFYHLVPYIRQYDILTFPEFFYKRYNSKSLQYMASCLMILSYVFYITMQIKGFGLVMKMLLDIPYDIAIFFIYLYILYTTFGGLYSVVKTDAVNTFMILMSVSAFGLYMIKLTGGIGKMLRSAAAIDTLAIQGYDIATPKGGLLDIFCKGTLPYYYILSSFFGWGLGLAANPQYIIRIVSAKSEKTAKKMILYSLSLLSLIYFFIIMGSLGLRVMIPTMPYVENIDEILPLAFSILVPNFAVGIMLIGVIAASLSTANSELLLIANSFTYDILKAFHKEKLDDDKMLSVNRLVIAITGTVALALSFQPPQAVIDFGGNIWGIFTSAFFVPLYIGLRNRNVSAISANVAFISGLFSYIALQILFNLFTAPFDKIHPGFFGFIISLISLFIAEGRTKHAKHRA